MKKTKDTQRFAALHYRDFRLLWWGLLISNIGTQMQFVAINWHIYILTHSAAALGIIGLSRFIPIAIFSFVSGSVADSHNRKKLILCAQIALMICSVALAFTTLTNVVSPLVIYTVTTLSAIAVAFDIPPRQALVPSLVKREHLTSALGLNVIMWQTSIIVGPAIAGIIIGQLGVGIIYLINAISFLAVIGALLLMKTSGEIEGKPTKLSFRSMIEGFVFVRSKTIIWSTMILDFFSTLFASATALLPIFAEQILHVGPTGFGFLFAAPAVGAVVAGYVLAHMGQIKQQGKLLIGAIVIYGIATILFGLSKLFLLSFICLFFVGVGDSISAIIRNTIRQLATPDHIRGRMTAVNMIFFMGGPQLGEFEAGMLAAFIGAPFATVLGGIGSLVVVAILSLKIPILRNYKGEKDS
jgi:MFS family permease